MCRRFRRLRRFANRVVEVTSRVWRVCKCCGSVNQDVQTDIVPFSAILNGRLPTRDVTNIPEDSGTEVCCFIRLFQRNSQTGYCVSKEDLPNIDLSVLHSSDNISKGQLNNVHDTTEISSSEESLHAEINSGRVMNSQSSQPSQQKSDTSLIDDNILKRFYGRISPTTGMFPAGILSQRQFPTPRNQIEPMRSVQFNTSVRLRLFVVQRPLHATPWIKTAEFFKKSTTKVSPICQTVCPSDLKVEFAEEPMWKSVFRAQWTVEESISVSRSSSVDLVMLHQFKKQVVVKKMLTPGSELESQILIECQSSYVVKLCACFVQGDSRYLCMSYYERRDLWVWLKKDEERQYFREREATWICAYVLSSVEYLHDRGILHLDINPSSILIDDKGYPVLTDFSKAQKREILGAEIENASVASSPQIGYKPDTRDDLFPVACLLYEIITGISPRHSDNIPGMEYAPITVDKLDVSMLSAGVKDYVVSQLSMAENKRLRCLEVMQHSVFRGIDWSEVKDSDRKRKCRLNKVFTMIQNAEWLSQNQADPCPPKPVPEADTSTSDDPALPMFTVPFGVFGAPVSNVEVPENG